MEEIWRPVAGYEGLYEASDYGRIRSLDMVVPCVYGATRTIKGRILKPYKTRNGKYDLVSLCKNQKRHVILAHRIIAQTFPDICGAWFEGCCVNHKDNDGHNNAAYTLKSATTGTITTMARTMKK